MTEVVTTGAEVIATGTQYLQQGGASQYYLIYVGVAICRKSYGRNKFNGLFVS